MTIYSQTQIYRDTYQLMLRLNRAMPHMPREARYTLGRSLNKTLIGVEKLVFRACAAYGTKKVTYIDEMRQMLVEAELYVRLMVDLKCISEGLYAELCPMLVSLSKQTALWEQKTKDAAQQGGTR